MYASLGFDIPQILNIILTPVSFILSITIIYYVSSLYLFINQIQQQ